MSETNWQPPAWARLIAYLVGVALFPGHIWLLEGGLNFGFLAIDSIVLIGLSDSVFKQMISLLPGGRSKESGDRP